MCLDIICSQGPSKEEHLKAHMKIQTPPKSTPHCGKNTRKAGNLVNRKESNIHTQISNIGKKKTKESLKDKDKILTLIYR